MKRLLPVVGPALAAITLMVSLALALLEPLTAAEPTMVRIAPPGQVPEPLIAGPPMTEAEVVTALRARLDSLTAAGAFSGAVLLAHGDRVLLRQAYGLAYREKRQPNTPETRFNIGSINKMFTRISIEQLAAAGKLSVTDTIARYLPDYPAEKGRRITIQQLLDHRGGTGDIFTQRYQTMDRSKLKTIGDWMNLIRDEPLAFEPGTRQQYSNAGYVLLGAIIERVSRQSYDDYVRSHIFEPAGMRATGFDAKPAERAVGYTREHGDAWQPNSGFLPARGSSAGGGYSTLDDLARFAAALRAGKLGGPSGSLSMGGGAPGTNALLEMTGDWTSVILANMDPPAANRVGTALRGWLRRAGAEPADGGPRVMMAGGAAGAAGEAAHVIHGGAPGGPMHKPEHTILPSAAVDVPMGSTAHLPTVDVMVNGKGPFRFAIDTGAAGMLHVDSAFAARLGLTKLGEAHRGDPSGTNMRVVPILAVDSVSIGGARFTGIIATARPPMPSMMPADDTVGLLGFGLFADCLFTLDYPAHRFRIEGGTLPEPDNASVIPFTNTRGVPVIPIRIAGRDLEADLDAGARSGFMLPQRMADSLPLAAPPRFLRQGKTVSNTFDVTIADLRGDIRIGGQTFTNPKVTFQPIYAGLNVGAEVLRDFRITFDQKKGRVRLVKPEGTAHR